MTLGPGDVPHWIAIAPDQRRVVITGYQALKHRVMIARFEWLRALQSLKHAFQTDVEPILAMARYRAGGAIDPVGLYRSSGYRQRVAKARPAAARMGAGIV